MPHATVASTRGPAPIKIYYELWGKSTAPNRVVFIMGLNNSCRSWQKQADYFQTLPDWQALLFDNRGVGSSDSPSGRYTTSEMALDTLELLLSIGWSQNIHCVGVSMGGMIAEELVLKCPVIFSSCILVSTHAGGTLPPVDDNWSVPSLTSIPRMLAMKDPTHRVPLMLPLLYPKHHLEAKAPADSGYETNYEMHRDSILDRIKRTRPQPLAGAIGQISAAMTHSVSEARLKLLGKSVPCMVVSGTIDNLVRPSNSFYLANTIGCRLEIYPLGGHALPSEQPEWFNKLILEFMLEANAKKANSIAASANGQINGTESKQAPVKAGLKANGKSK
ncbi:hypothetical protein SmJEL517_g00510 [Synchytrium microbalum]|uniref:AB hydrolase-1 domain-containing protein n=1 Tax=Synchytrium microbalum TaxID=1806994 RepID=A0A507C9G4_9FUNG|nr:uncharacterized protein SmJEL517_g00510 [Synchytrium microbalum]TPX37717.1 hypothetical protein SmJEL517_g00510 [Synchytrium microbalum]